MTAAPKTRNYDLDVLYIVVLGGVIVSHLMIPFTPLGQMPPYPIRNPTVYQWIHAAALITGIGAIPVFFLLSGWTSMAALRRYSWGHYLWERAKRLLVPLVLGMIFITPIIKYVELRTGYVFTFDGPRFDGSRNISYLEFLPKAATMKKSSWQHLWFLIYLFSISVVTCPILVWLGKADRFRLPEAKTLTRHLAYAYLPMVPAMALLVVMGGFWPFYPTLVTDGAHLSFFALWFVMGAVLALNPPLERAVRREWWRLGLLGVVTFFVHWTWHDEVWGYVFIAVSGWGLFGGMLGLIERLKPRGGPLLIYLRDATLPVYIIHNVFVILVGYQILALDWSVLPKFLTMAVLAMGSTFLVYHFWVRPVPAMRFAFGLRPIKRVEAAKPQAARQAAAGPAE
ncbi:MAG TPA: acyltransferase family protein [Alphaproteobacteria bacterium]|nr:acyltransferase family protein [Alphaproteobacteria bacterium]